MKVHRTPVNHLRRRLITVETHTMTIIRPSHSRRWCRKCAREVEVAPIAEAGQLIGMTQLVLEESAETEKWHVLEDMDGSIQVCLDSLLGSE